MQEINVLISSNKNARSQDEIAKHAKIAYPRQMATTNFVANNIMKLKKKVNSKTSQCKYVTQKKQKTKHRIIPSNLKVDIIH